MHRSFDGGTSDADGRGDARVLADAEVRCPQGDFDRSMNQGRVLLAAFSQFRAEFRRDPAALFHWIAVGMRNVSTDLPLNELLTLASRRGTSRPARLTNLVAVGSVGTAGGASIVILPSPNPVFEDIAADGYILPAGHPGRHRTSRLACVARSRPRLGLLAGRPSSAARSCCCWRSASPSPHAERRRPGEGRGHPRCRRGHRRRRDPRVRFTKLRASWSAPSRSRLKRRQRRGERRGGGRRPHLLTTCTRRDSSIPRTGRGPLRATRSEDSPAGRSDRAETRLGLLTAGARAGDRYERIEPMSGRIDTRILLDRQGSPRLLLSDGAVLRGRHGPGTRHPPLVGSVLLRTRGRRVEDRVVPRDPDR